MNYNNTYPTLYEDAGGGRGTTGNTNLVNWAQPCDSCGAAPGSVYCHADAAYLCNACDSRVHVANRVASRHERVPVCNACEQAPAVLACRADAAALCAACDALVHSANPLAGRHQRVPILPLPSFFPESTNDGTTTNVVKENNEEDNEIMYGGDVDEYLDMAELNSCYENLGDANQEGMIMQETKSKEGTECIVPSHVMAAATAPTGEASTLDYSYTASRSNSVSFSSLEASVVPDTTINDISNSHLLPSNGALDLYSGSTLQMHLHFSAVDREARVMRYKEKKKMRKFEKTIRYASRKAYAEARPRIKGRFAKRSDMDLEVDQMFSPSALSEGSYGAVPWF
ncbi:hypothetical protein LUZ61_002978 [Rhynchospora tenuis]|uniref:Uncharacterized protein n=1 Tax=Rhynchospora tenuis TaxID=198213 RepID=A0AAD5ZK06_9POAL|nr:hypothetical protein LUZ61_002978 [Rhynchospora tenuis]